MKHRKHRATGGVNEAAEDEASKPHRYNSAPKIQDAAEERKKGGKVKKHVPMHGEKGEHHAGRKPRKSGGAAVFSAAHAGVNPPGHKTGA